VHHARAPERHGEPRRIEHAVGTRARRVPQHPSGIVTLERGEDRLVLRRERLGQHAVHDHGAERHGRLFASAGHQVDRLVDRHLLRRGHDVERRESRVREDLEHPLRLIADRTGVHQLADRARRVELRQHVAGRGGIDDDEVPGGPALDGLPHLPAHLADGEDLLHARSGVGDEVEDVRERADAPDHRDLEVEPEVLAQ
jgi:hypothetical protein